MAKTRTTQSDKRARRAKAKAKASNPTPNLTTAPTTPPFNPQHAQSLLDAATASLHTGDPASALTTAQEALTYLSTSASTSASTTTSSPLLQLPALELIGEIHIELGDADAARNAFTKAADLYPDADLSEEAGGGADKFLWLAQLCEEGGTASISWFEKGIKVLRRDVEAAERDAVDTGADTEMAEETKAELALKQQKLASALCGAAEVYMTDLSWDLDAEARASALAHSAVATSPLSPESLQTLASVLISQQKLPEARTALTKSLDLWQHLPPEDGGVPDFATRISLGRLLMECAMREEALGVLERLVGEDDGSVEAWYLGGWCLFLLAEELGDLGEPGEPSKNAEQEEEQEAKTTAAQKRTRKSSRDWLDRSLKLYEMLDYEDERLREHAIELIEGLDKELGPRVEGELDAGEDDEDGWEDDEDDANGDNDHGSESESGDEDEDKDETMREPHA